MMMRVHQYDHPTKHSPPAWAFNKPENVAKNDFFKATMNENVNQ